MRHDVRHGWMFAIACILSGTFVAANEIKLLPAAEGQPVRVEISSKGLRSPVVVEKVYLFTKVESREQEAEGVREVVLNGPPESVRSLEPGFQGSWRVGKRDISVSISHQKDVAEVRISAQPADDISQWGIALGVGPGERFTGLMERVVDGPQEASWARNLSTALDLRGLNVNMSVAPTVALYSPFFISSRGYGLFAHGTWRGAYSFPAAGQSGMLSIAFAGPSLRLWLHTDGVLRAVQAHMRHTGPLFVPPAWAFQPWRWRDTNTHRSSYFDGSPATSRFNSEVVEDVLMCEALGVPLGVVLLDRPWAKGKFGYDDFEWDIERYPDPEGMIAWLGARGIRTLLWICPWAVGTRMKGEAEVNGYLVPGTYCVDFSDPRARKWWQESGLRKLLDAGVAGFKLDRGEENALRGQGKIRNGKEWAEAYNDYSRAFAEAAHDACRVARGDDFCLLARAAYTGSARHTAFWGGDVDGSSMGLRAAIIGGLRSSVIGYPIWGSDTGGYRFRDAEVACRWLAFSCFCPIMEVGPMRNDGPWAIGRELTACWRMYAVVHSKLAEYTRACAEEARETGMPVMRPLFLNHPDREEAWEDWQTYLYGPDLLVSPEWRAQREVVREVYLPPKDVWIDAWTGKRHEGGVKVSVRCPIYKIPLFIRQGATVDLGDLNALWEESQRIVRTLPRMSELEKKAKVSRTGTSPGSAVERP